MLEYSCTDCGMGVKGLTCTKCGCELEHQVITNPEGEEIQVSECPKGCGKIKSPICCGHDMNPEAH